MPANAFEVFLNQIRLAFHQFSYDMRRNPRTWLLGYIGATAAIGVGVALAGAGVSAYQESRKINKPVTQYKRKDVVRVANAAQRGAGEDNPITGALGGKRR